MKKIAMKTLALVLLLLCTAATPLGAAELKLDSSLNETVLMIPKKGLFTINLETTLYKPEGAGPFPVVIINHGKAYGNPRFQDRYRPVSGVRYFLQRGYAVVVPMRQGFAKSEGSYIGGGCNIESNGAVQASDVKAVLDYVTAQPWADREQMLMVGQSHGGWTTLAFGRSTSTRWPDCTYAGQAETRGCGRCRWGRSALAALAVVPAGSTDL